MVQIMNDQSDAIPKGHISLEEAFRVYRTAKRGTQCNDAPPHSDPAYPEWHADYSKCLDADEKSLAAAFSTGALEALVYSERRKREERITPSEWQGGFWPTRSFLTGDILDMKDSPLAKHNGRTPYVHRESLLSWIEPNVKDWMLGEIADGRLLPTEAESRLAAMQFTTLLPQPDPSDFHPEREVFWSLAMAVAWISWRDMRAVARQWPEFTKHGTWWRASRTAEQTTPGFVLESQSEPTLLDLMSYEAMELNVVGLHQRQPVKASRVELWSKLQSGEIEASGISQETGQRRNIAAHEWQDLDVCKKGNKEIVAVNMGSMPHEYHAVTIPSKTVLKIWDMLPTGQATSKSPAPPIPLLSRQELEQAYKRRANDWPEGQETPSIDEDWEFLKGLRSGIARDRAREFRRKFAPPEWTKPGRRKESGD